MRLGIGRGQNTWMLAACRLLSPDSVVEIRLVLHKTACNIVQRSKAQPDVSLCLFLIEVVCCSTSKALILGQASWKTVRAFLNNQGTGLAQRFQPQRGLTELEIPTAEEVSKIHTLPWYTMSILNLSTFYICRYWLIVRWPTARFHEGCCLSWRSNEAPSRANPQQILDVAQLPGDVSITWARAWIQPPNMVFCWARDAEACPLLWTLIVFACFVFHHITAVIFLHTRISIMSGPLHLH